MKLALVLVGVWVLLSGIIEPLLLGLGLASALGVAWLKARADRRDRDPVPVALRAGRLPGYLLWLSWEIFKSNVDVARRILSPSLPIAPSVRWLPASQRTELARVIYANSITLTPGDVVDRPQGRMGRGPRTGRRVAGCARNRVPHGCAGEPARPRTGAVELMDVTALGIAALAVLAAMAITLIRALRGPTVYDRVLAVNSFGTLTVVVLALHGFLTERPEFLDIAMLYALINFVGTVAVLKFFEYGDLGAAGGTGD